MPNIQVDPPDRPVHVAGTAGGGAPPLAYLVILLWLVGVGLALVVPPLGVPLLVLAVVVSFVAAEADHA